MTTAIGIILRQEEDKKYALHLKNMGNTQNKPLATKEHWEKLRLKL